MCCNRFQSQTLQQKQIIQRSGLFKNISATMFAYVKLALCALLCFIVLAVDATSGRKLLDWDSCYNGWNSWRGNGWHGDYWWGATRDVLSGEAC